MKIQVFTQGELSTNCAVLSKNGKCVVIDLPYNAYEVIEYVLSNKLQVEAILLTHGHFDHCGGVVQFARLCYCNDVRVFCSQKDFDLCHKAADNKWAVICEDCYPTNAVDEGQLTVGDFVFKVIATPGHTMGSVMYVCGDFLFSGDTLFCNSIGRTDFPESNALAMKQSLRKIKSLQTNYTVIPGHGELTTLEREKSNNIYLK